MRRGAERGRCDVRVVPDCSGKTYGRFADEHVDRSAHERLDSESEALVKGALDNLMRAGTSMVVAHHLSSVAALDRIVVLEEGIIVGDSTHLELSQVGGVYESFWDRQTGAFLKEESNNTTASVGIPSHQTASKPTPSEREGKGLATRIFSMSALVHH